MTEKLFEAVRLHGLTMCKNESIKVLGVTLRGLDSAAEAGLKRIKLAGGSSKVLFFTIDIYSFKAGSDVADEELRNMATEWVGGEWPDGYMSRQDVAKVLCVSPATVTRGALSDLIRPVVKGTGRRPGLYSAEDLLSFLFDNRE